MADIKDIIARVKEKKEAEKKALEQPKIEEPKQEDKPQIEANKPIEEANIKELLKDDGLYRNELLAQLVLLNKTLVEIKDGLVFIITKE